MFKLNSLCLLQQHIPAAGVAALLAELEHLQAMRAPVLDGNAAGTVDMHSSSGGSSNTTDSQGASGVAAVQAKDIQVPETQSSTPETLWNLDAGATTPAVKGILSACSWPTLLAFHRAGGWTDCRAAAAAPAPVSVTSKPRLVAGQGGPLPAVCKPYQSKFAPQVQQLRSFHHVLRPGWCACRPRGCLPPSAPLRWPACARAPAARSRQPDCWRRTSSAPQCALRTRCWRPFTRRSMRHPFQVCAIDLRLAVQQRFPAPGIFCRRGDRQWLLAGPHAGSLSQAVLVALTTRCKTCTHTGVALQRLAAWTASDTLADADEPLLRLAVPICLQQLRSALRRGQLAEVASDPARHASQVSPSLSELMRLWLPACNHRLLALRTCRPQCLLPATLLECEGSQSMHGPEGFTSCLPQVLTSLTRRSSRRATRRQVLPFFTELLASGGAAGGQVNCFTEVRKRFGATSLSIGGP